MGKLLLYSVFWENTEDRSGAEGALLYETFFQLEVRRGCGTGIAGIYRYRRSFV